MNGMKENGIIQNGTQMFIYGCILLSQVDVNAWNLRLEMGKNLLVFEEDCNMHLFATQ